MAENNQFFLAVTATVALVSIVALVILVLNAASPQASYYVQPTLESAANVAELSNQVPVEEGNLVGGAYHKCEHLENVVAESTNAIQQTAAARLLSWGACS